MANLICPSQDIIIGYPFPVRSTAGRSRGYDLPRQVVREVLCHIVISTAGIELNRRPNNTMLGAGPGGCTKPCAAQPGSLELVTRHRPLLHSFTCRVCAGYVQATCTGRYPWWLHMVHASRPEVWTVPRVAGVLTELPCSVCNEPSVARVQL